MQKEYNTKKYVLVNSKVEEQNKETKGRHGKNAVCQDLKQMDQKYEEVLHSATRLGQACGHRLLYTCTYSKIHETKILIRVLMF